ncbi:Hexose_transporter [Hexamita inflata]|uniref:Hexose transporter n=1 Tax=Hexamita inflata TaxID=28002 RepID=A0AA86PZH1_9EUKA|nr:Hexose transporter [Hexamita inflata]
MNVLICAYIFSGLSRGSLVTSMSTVIITSYHKYSFIKFELTKPVISAVSVAVLTGSALGSCVAAPLINRFGRKRTLIVFSIVQIISEILCIIPVHWVYLFVFRIVAGVASNFIMSVVPMLCAEFIQPKLRGIVGSVLNASICCGIVLTNLVQYFICLQDQLYWIIIIIPVASSILTLIISFKLQETSQLVGKVENTTKIFQKQYTKCFIVAFGLGFMLSGTGINTVLQYSTIIFKNSFNSKKSSSIGALISSSINMISSFIAVPIIRKIHRKKIISSGFSVMLIAYILYIISQQNFILQDQSNTLVIIASCLISFACASSSSPMCYIVNSEVFPLAIKTKMMVIVMFINFSSLITITFIFPLISLTNNVFIYICFVIMMLIVLMIYLPETKGKTLQENSDKMTNVQLQKTVIDEQNDDSVSITIADTRQCVEIALQK